MGYQNEGDAQFALQCLQFDLHGRTQFLVECRKRFVQKQHGRLIDQCARQGHALLLSTGHFMDTTLAEPAKPHHFQRLANPAGYLGRTDLRAGLP